MRLSSSPRRYGGVLRQQGEQGIEILRAHLGIDALTAELVRHPDDQFVYRLSVIVSFNKHAAVRTSCKRNGNHPKHPLRKPI